MRAVSLTIAILTLCSCGGAADDRPASVLEVIDGDTVAWHGRARDLAGIDAPELGQSCQAGKRAYPCGTDAAFALKKRVALEPARCEAAGDDEIVCHVGGTSLADLQVSDGLAFSREDAGQSLRLAEEQARKAGLGVWRGEHVRPAAWRAGERLASEAGSPAAPCPVIGVPGARGTAYVVPTDEAYRGLRDAPDAPRACSDEEARERGWRHVGERVSDRIPLGL